MKSSDAVAISTCFYKDVTENQAKGANIETIS